MPQPGSALNMITGLKMSEPAGPQRPICHPSRSFAFPYSYLFPCSCVWFSAHGPFALLRGAEPHRDRRFSDSRAVHAELPQAGKALLPGGPAAGKRGSVLTPPVPLTPGVPLPSALRSTGALCRGCAGCAVLLRVPVALRALGAPLPLAAAGSWLAARRLMVRALLTGELGKC